MLQHHHDGTVPLTCILVSHAKAVLVQDAIHSLLAQTYPDFEVIIIDSGVLYDTGLFDRLPLDSRFKVIRSPEDENVRQHKVPHSWCVNWCYGQGLINGEITTYLCDDDIYYSRAFETIIKAYKAHEDWEACYLPIDWATVTVNGIVTITGRSGVGTVGGSCCNGQTMNCVVDYLQFNHKTALLDALAPTCWPEERWNLANADGVFMERIGSLVPIHPVDGPPIGQNRVSAYSKNRGDPAQAPPPSVRPKETAENEQLGQLLAVMQQPSRTSLPDLRIITAADAGYFVPLQLLLLSILATHEVQITVIDIGLTESQREWCKRQKVECIRFDENKLIMPKAISFWQTWNKPAYLSQFTGRIFWIDADCVVLNSLKWVDEMLRHRPVIVSCMAAPYFLGKAGGELSLRNSAELYEYYPVKERLEELPNAGVCAFDLPRDRDLLDTWLWMIREATFRAEACNLTKYKQGWLKWFDQGALQWALERLGLTELTIRDRRLNDPITVAGPKTPHQLAADIEYCDSKILHFPADGKPYKAFPPVLDVEAADDAALTLLVLGRDYEKLAGAKAVPCGRVIYLPELDPANDLAENRIFHSDVLLRYKTPYVGLCTESWNKKYQKKCWPLEKLHLLPMSPKVVWAAYYAAPWWSEESEVAHPGILAIMQELSMSWDMQLRSRSLWSNNFIAHRDVVLELTEFHRWAMPLVLERWGWMPPYSTEQQDGKVRKMSYLAERLSMMWFATRTDLDIVQIPCDKPRFSPSETLSPSKTAIGQQTSTRTDGGPCTPGCA